MKKILFLSKDNLTTNPRLKKELFLAVEKGYEVHFIGFNLNNWSQELENKIDKSSFKATYLPITKKDNFLLWLLASFAEKVARFIYPIFPKSLLINTIAHSKRSFVLLLKMKKIKFDHIRAHTLPTLYPAYLLAKKTKTKFSFDIEDYHPGEKINLKNPQKEIDRRIYLLKKLIPKTDFFTYASPLIGEQIKKLFSPKTKLPNNFYIANCFPKSMFEFRENNSQKIKFVWFSQNIAQGRGLELFLEGAKKFKNQIEIHLIGNLYTDFYEKHLKNSELNIFIHKPMPEEELYKFLGNFDIGLALENTKSDFNRDICLTNKIYAYAQSGLFILATNTKGQSWFLSKYPDFGILVMPFLNDYFRKLQFITNNINEIRQNKIKRFELGKKMSWDFEKEKIEKFL